MGRSPGIIRVGTERGEWSFDVRNADSVHFTKQIPLGRSYEIIEAYGPFWMLGIVRLRGGVVSYDQDGDRVSFAEERWGVFYPPNSLAIARVHGVHLEAEALWSKAILPASSGIPEVPIRFALLPDTPFPASTADVVRYLRRSAGTHRSIARSTRGSILSTKAKTAIDRSFASEEATIGEIATRLRTSPSQLSRAFRKDLGLSPVRYRNHLRVAVAKFMLLQGSSSIAAVAGAVGFEDLGRFYKAIKGASLLTPGAFRKRS